MDYGNPTVTRFRREKVYYYKKQQNKKLVIFMGIDMVIQHDSFQNRHDYDLPTLCKYLSEKYNNPIYEEMDEYDVGATYYDWNMHCIGFFRELSRIFNAGIIVHAGLTRYNSLENIKALFGLYDMSEYIIATVGSKTISKVDGIRNFLTENPEIDDYLVIDFDTNVIQKFPGHAIKIDCMMSGQEFNIAYKYFMKYLH